MTEATAVGVHPRGGVITRASGGADRPVQAAREAAVQHLLRRQNAAGWWTAELETNVTMTAEYVLLLAILGRPSDRIRSGAIQHILSAQRDDGSWAIEPHGPADVSTTIEAYTALRILGVNAGDDALLRARRVVLQQGGLAHARVFTKIWLALIGEYPWDGVPSMPPELIHLRPWMPLNLYDFASWARGTIAPLLVVLSRKPVRPVGVSVQELVLPGTEALMRRVPGGGPFWWLDRLQKLYERLPLQPGRPASRRRVLRWVTARQEADGSWGGIQPPWVYSIIALHIEGMPLEHPVIARALSGLDGFALEDAHAGWRLQACVSPVWDTALTVLALHDCGVPADHDSIRRATDWLLDEQIDVGGDWQVRTGNVECGGWAFEFANDTYPDVDDTAEVVIALAATRSDARAREAIERAVRWVLAMRSSNGAWAAFDRNNTRRLALHLPFADFGALLDPPSEDVTSHAVEMLAAVGHGRLHPAVEAGIVALRRWQREDGSWHGRWGVNHLYGTWSGLTALAAQGFASDPSVTRGADWLEARQNPDGGWGETWHSYADPSFAGVGASTPSQTAWALLGLRAAGRARGAAHARGIDHLVRTQREGTWDESSHTGTGFPSDFAIAYHHYRSVFPTWALAAGSDHD